MHYEMVRPTLLLLVCGVTLGMTSCGSNNDGGKIVGKWKFVSSTGSLGKDIEELKSSGFYMCFEFNADKTFAKSFGADTEEKLEFFKKEMAAQGMANSSVYPGKYSLGSGDIVRIRDFKGSDGNGFDGKSTGLFKIKVNGDTMTLTDSEGTSTLIKVPAGQ